MSELAGSRHRVRQFSTRRVLELTFFWVLIAAVCSVIIAGLLFSGGGGK